MKKKNPLSGIPTTTKPSTVEEVKEETGSLQRMPSSLAKEDQPVASTSISSAADFVKVEKNIVSLGFFSPSSSRAGNAKPKMMTFARTENGQRIKESVTITPGYIEDASGKPKAVLPNTADQDKYLAFHKLLMERRRKYGTITNPIEFTSTELLRLLGVNCSSGKNLKEIAEWLDVMASATVMSKLVWHAGEKRWGKGRDRYHVFARAVSIGEQYEPGKIAEVNIVWLDPWQLENLTHNFTLPIDFETYRCLKNHISKALVPHLQIWLYASRDKGLFENRYDELCQIFSLTQYTAISRITQQLKPSFDELKSYGYLARWTILNVGETRDYKIVFCHGPKFYRDRNQLPPGSTAALLLDVGETPSEEEGLQLQSAEDHFERSMRSDLSDLRVEMAKRGISGKKIEPILAGLSPDQEVLDQLEWGDFLIAEAREGRTRPVRNPPGFYVHLVVNNIAPPDTFITSRRRRLFEEERKACHEKEAEQERRKEAYYQYCSDAVSKHIEAYSPEEYEKLLQNEKEEANREDPIRFRSWKAETVKTYLVSRFRARVRARLSLKSFEEFCRSLG